MRTVATRTGTLLLKTITALLLAWAVMTAAAIPRGMQPDASGRPRFSAGTVLSGPFVYLRALASGRALLYRAGSVERNFLEEVPPYLTTSLVYLCGGSLLGLAVGLGGGFLLYRRYLGLPRTLISFFNSVPDFLLIITAQLLVVTVTRLTGVRLASISPYGSDSPILLLPMLALALYAGFYVVQCVVADLYRHSSEPFILFAKSQGLSRSRILRLHLLSAVLPALEGEVYRITGLLLANLCITEALFILPGMTRFLFRYGFQIYRPDALASYQYFLVVDCLAVLIGIYLASIALLRLALLLLRRFAG